MNNAMTYGGSPTINAGTLSGNGNVTTTSTTAINNNATLGGLWASYSGTLNMAANARVSPGNDRVVGTLTKGSNGITFGANDIFFCDLGTNPVCDVLDNGNNPLSLSALRFTLI